MPEKPRPSLMGGNIFFEVLTQAEGGPPSSRDLRALPVLVFPCFKDSTTNITASPLAPGTKMTPIFQVGKLRLRVETSCLVTS